MSNTATYSVQRVIKQLDEIPTTAALLTFEPITTSPLFCRLCKSMSRLDSAASNRVAVLPPGTTMSTGCRPLTQTNGTKCLRPSPTLSSSKWSKAQTSASGPIQRSFDRDEERTKIATNVLNFERLAWSSGRQRHFALCVCSHCAHPQHKTQQAH